MHYLALQKLFPSYSDLGLPRFELNNQPLKGAEQVEELVFQNRKWHQFQQRSFHHQHHTEPPLEPMLLDVELRLCRPEQQAQLEVLRLTYPERESKEDCCAHPFL